MECVKGGSKRCRDRGREGCRGFQAVAQCCRWGELHLEDAASSAPRSQLWSLLFARVLGLCVTAWFSLCSAILDPGLQREQTVMQLQAVSSLCPVPFLNFGCFFLGLKWQILWDNNAVFTFVFIEHLREILARLGHSAFFFFLFFFPF